MDNSQNENIEFSVLNGDILTISKDRVNDDYGTGHLDNRWDVNEIDIILNSLKGTWTTDKYIGFVSSSLYYPDLYDGEENLEESVRENLYESYEDKVNQASKNVPNITFSIKKNWRGETKNNYIYVDDVYPSPISLVLSLDRLADNYPIFVDRTTISSDFYVEYPVLYIQFFNRYYEENVVYEPATLVISNDEKFYLLVDGAFYSLKRIEDD